MLCIMRRISDGKKKGRITCHSNNKERTWSASKASSRRWSCSCARASAALAAFKSEPRLYSSELRLLGGRTKSSL